MPRQFKDNKGQQWTITITLKKCRYVRDRLPLDIFNPADWTELIDSLANRLAYVWWLVADQAKELDVSDEQFEERLYGKGIADNASNEFLAELADFFRRLDQTLLVTLTDLARELHEKQKKRATDPKVTEEIRRKIEEITNPVSMPGAKSPD